MKAISSRGNSKLFLLIFLSLTTLLFSCNRKPSAWEVKTFDTREIRYNFARIIHPCKNPFTSLSLEFDYGNYSNAESGEGYSWRGYLNVYTRTVPPYFEDGKEAQVAIFIQEKKSIYYASLFAGGQRLLLPDDATQEIMNALLANEVVVIMLAGYEEIFDPAGFEDAYQKALTVKNPAKF